MMNIKMVQEQIDKYMIKEFTEPTWNKIKVKIKQGMIVIFATFVFILPDSETIADKNAKITKIFIESIPEVVMIDKGKLLKDIIQISNGRLEGKVCGFGSNIYTKLREEELIEYYNREFLKNGWFFWGSYEYTNGGDYAVKNYIWKNDFYFIKLKLDAKELKYYQEHGAYKNVKGLLYDLYMEDTKSLSFKNEMKNLCTKK